MPKKKFTYVITTTLTTYVEVEAENVSEAEDIIQNEYMDAALESDDIDTTYHMIPNKIACISKYFADIGGEIHEITEEEFDHYKLEGARHVEVKDGESFDNIDEED